VAALADEIGYQALDRGVKSDLLAGKPYGHFFSLRGPMPSALVEHLFLSNATEAALLRDDATLDALADGCAQGILEYFSSSASTSSSGATLGS
jgi:N-acetylmuramoyl-L-alanine amidase